MGPGLTRARSVAAKLTAAQEKARFFGGQEGADAANREVGAVYDHLLAVLDQVAAEAPALRLEHERARHEVIVRTPRTSARINWYLAFTNTLDGARITIWTYKWRQLLPSERSRSVMSIQPIEVSKTEFWPDYTAEQGLCWSDPNGRHLSSAEVGDRLAKEFFDVVDWHENSDEEMPLR